MRATSTYPICRSPLICLAQDVSPVSPQAKQAALSPMIVSQELASEEEEPSTMTSNSSLCSSPQRIQDVTVPPLVRRSPRRQSLSVPAVSSWLSQSVPNRHRLPPGRGRKSTSQKVPVKTTVLSSTENEDANKENQPALLTLKALWQSREVGLRVVVNGVVEMESVFTPVYPTTDHETNSKKRKAGRQKNPPEPLHTSVSSSSLNATVDNDGVYVLVAMWKDMPIRLRVLTGKTISGGGEETPEVPEAETPTNASTSDFQLKPLIGKTPLKGDGTPFESVKNRPVYEDDDHGHDESENTEENALLPAVSTGPASPLASSMKDAPSTVITKEELNQRLQDLFPVLSEPQAVCLNCVAARLFACFSLDLDAQSHPVTEQQDSSLSPGKQQHATNATSAQGLQEILPLLTSLIKLELSLLHGEAELLKSVRRHRRVAFCAFDGSALQPPSDVIEDSHKQKQSEIESLSEVVHQINQLLTTGSAKSYSLLQKLIRYLQSSCVKAGHTFVCAQSLSLRFFDFPVPRVQKAAKRYATDLQQMLSSVDSAHANPWHCRLADATAQMVRYWLRTELNPVPDRAPCDNYSSNWNLRLCDWVLLKLPETSTSIAAASHDTALQDGSLSSLVSYAASHISCYFGTDWNEWKARLDDTPDKFGYDCELAVRGIAPTTCRGRRKSGIAVRKYPSEDWHRLLQLVDVATGFLAAIHGVQFMHDLLSIVVQQAPFGKKWYNSITLSAQQMSLVSSSLQDGDRHLLLLQHPPSALLDKLGMILKGSPERQMQAQTFLKSLPEKFLMDPSSAKQNHRRLKDHQPYATNLQQDYEHAVAKIILPRVYLATDEADESDDSDSYGDKS